MPHDNTLAYMDASLKHLEKGFETLIDVQRQQAFVNANLEKTIALLQQSHNDFVRNHEKEFAPKILTLWENRSQFKGGYIVVSIICSLLVGAATIAGVVYSIKTAH